MVDSLQARSLGIDVGERFLDVVALSEERELVSDPIRCHASELQALLLERQPDVVAIDCPSGWALAGRRRECEALLRAASVNIYAMPMESVGREHAFHRWVLHGLEAYVVCFEQGYSLYSTGPVQAGHVMEVFPHASTVALLGHLPNYPKKAEQRTVRTQVLHDHGVVDARLRNLDQVDAAVAALTGLLALEGVATPVGDPEEGVIVLPAVAIPDRFRRQAEQRTPSMEGLDDAMNRLAAFAAERGESVAEVLRTAISEYLDRHRRA